MGHPLNRIVAHRPSAAGGFRPRAASLLAVIPLVATLLGACAPEQPRTALPQAQVAASETDSASAHRAAVSWLALVDAGLFEASLDSAAPLLRQMAGSVEGWAAFMRQARGRHPVSGTRMAIAWEPDYFPEAAPPGDYARITFESPGPPRTREFVVLVRKDDDWRVAMYGLGGG